MNKKVLAAGCVLWIVGLAAFIIGLNVSGTTGQWLTVCGSILFLTGLLIVGADRFMKMREANKNNQTNQKDSD